MFGLYIITFIYYVAKTDRFEEGYFKGTGIPESESIQKIRIDMIKIRKRDNVILAASHGRGLFTATLTIISYTPDFESDERYYFYYQGVYCVH